MKVHVEVTQEDIDNGEQGDGNACMIARAFARATEGAFPEAYVHRTAIRCDADGMLADLPAWVTQRQRRWDRGRYNFRSDELSRTKTRPFSFDVDLPLEPVSA